MSLLSAIRSEKHTVLGLARFYAPFDTGNLRYNAITVGDIPDGIGLNYDLSSAFYIYFLEEGTKYTTKHQGFIANQTVPAIASYIQAKFADGDQDLIGYYEHNALVGNYDSIRWNAIHGGSYGARYQMQAREERRYDSALANMQNYGHMSNVHQWAHQSGYETYQTNLRQRF